ncbi:hypothetical protein T492DRAFT_12536, partial [Pavlovales sp. CCMP2436]
RARWQTTRPQNLPLGRESAPRQRPWRKESALRRRPRRRPQRSPVVTSLPPLLPLGPRRSTRSGPRRRPHAPRSTRPKPRRLPSTGAAPAVARSTMAQSGGPTASAGQRRAPCRRLLAPSVLLSGESSRPTASLRTAPARRSAKPSGPRPRLRAPGEGTSDELGCDLDPRLCALLPIDSGCGLTAALTYYHT